MSRSFQTLVLAAGQGTRMKSDTVKVLHEVAGRPLIWHVMKASLDAGAERVVVILGHQKDDVEAYLEEHFSGRYVVAEQKEQLGTGHAVLSASEFLTGGPSHSVIVSGDVPNMNADTLAKFWDESKNFGFAVMTAELDNPAHYGRIKRTEEGDVVGIVEYKDATEEERQIDEINAGFYVAESSFLKVELDKLCAGPAHNAQGEYYLTDLIAVAAEDAPVLGWPVPDVERIQGVNTRADLACAEAFARRELTYKWMTEGVTFLDPESTYLEVGVELARDVVIHPGVHLKGSTTVASGSTLENGVVARDSVIGADVLVKANCYLDHARVGDSSTIGPFAHLRPGAVIGSECKVGNFVEIKKTTLGNGAKASHLSYLGDAIIGAGANVGAGTITCNYDGKNKHVTRIGDGAFIGSNTALVAPVEIGDGAYVGAGSTITRDVPEGGLGVARGRQQNIEGWARRRTMRDEEE